MQRLFFSFIKIGRRVVGVHQYFITCFLRSFFVHMSIKAASVVCRTLSDISCVDGRRYTFLVVGGTTVVHFRSINHHLERNCYHPVGGTSRILYHSSLFRTKSCIVVSLALKITVAGEKIKRVSIRLSGFQYHVQIMIRCDLIPRSRMILCIRKINVIVADKVSRFVQIDKLRVLRCMVNCPIDGNHCIFSG